MKLAIRYYTKGGNTKKLADAIAKAVGVDAKTISNPLTEDVDILFLGSSVYGFDIDNEMKKFIKNINVNVGKVVNFSTAAFVKSTYKQVAKQLEKKNIPLAKEEFACKGSFTIFNKNKPDEEDCQKVALFAQNIVKTLSK